MKYKIEITETLQRQIWVEAYSKADALHKVRIQYGNAEIVLDAEDLKETTITSLNEKMGTR